MGTGEDISIAELASRVRDTVYPSAEIVFDTTKPDGAPRKLLDVTRLHALGWQHGISLTEGIASTYDWFVNKQQTARTEAGRHAGPRPVAA